MILFANPAKFSFAFGRIGPTSRVQMSSWVIVGCACFQNWLSRRWQHEPHSWLAEVLAYVTELHNQRQNQTKTAWPDYVTGDKNRLFLSRFSIIICPSHWGNCSFQKLQNVFSSPGPVKWLRKSEPSEAFDLGFDKILIDGISYAEIREESIENDHFPQIYTFRKRKCEIISKVSNPTAKDRLRYLSDICFWGKNLILF